MAKPPSMPNSLSNKQPVPHARSPSKHSPSQSNCPQQANQSDRPECPSNAAVDLLGSSPRAVATTSIHVPAPLVIPDQAMSSRNATIQQKEPSPSTPMQQVCHSRQEGTAEVNRDCKVNGTFNKGNETAQAQALVANPKQLNVNNHFSQIQVANTPSREKPTAIMTSTEYITEGVSPVTRLIPITTNAEHRDSSQSCKQDFMVVAQVTPTSMNMHHPPSRVANGQMAYSSGLTESLDAVTTPLWQPSASIGEQTRAILTMDAVQQQGSVRKPHPVGSDPFTEKWVRSLDGIEMLEQEETVTDVKALESADKVNSANEADKCTPAVKPKGTRNDSSSEVSVLCD